MIDTSSGLPRSLASMVSWGANSHISRYETIERGVFVKIITINSVVAGGELYETWIMVRVSGYVLTTASPQTMKNERLSCCIQPMKKP